MAAITPGRADGLLRPTYSTTSSPAPRDSSIVIEHPPEEVDGIVRRVISEVLGSKPYSTEMMDYWSDTILAKSLGEISARGRPFKYMATCVISKQQSGKVLDTAATAFWDTQSDSLCCTRLGNGMMDCIVTVYACRR
eukprot:TRINITY_DN41336_c0_g1_i1.p1 TRINITY_DN41336_c0_g1~~TRINITY_DN41336_c0_g1_i1.p1  ORF type:complete len:137 (+),score=12.09 TRINITY_DN41336_c0_g1_i1:65-475(+)